MGKKSSLKKFYAYFYQTGTIRKVLAKDLGEAYDVAAKMFGPATGQYTIGSLRRGPEPVGAIPIERGFCYEKRF